MLNLIHKKINNHAKDKLKKTQLQQDGCYTIVRLSFETPSSSFTVQLVYLLLGHITQMMKSVGQTLLVQSVISTVIVQKLLYSVFQASMYIIFRISNGGGQISLSYNQ